MPSVSFSDNAEIDSLTNFLRTAKPDTNRVVALNDLAWDLQYTKTDSAILLSLEALRISEQKHWLKGIGKSCHSLGWLYTVKADYSKAVQYGNRALSVWDLMEKPENSGQEIGFSVYLQRSKTFGNLGSVYNSQGNYPKALDCFLTALKISEELKNKPLEAVWLGNIGLLYSHQGKYPEALQYLLKAESLKEEVGDRFGMSVTLGNIGVVFMQQAVGYTDTEKADSSLDKAMEYLLKALEIEKELNGRIIRTQNLTNLAMVYKKRRQYETALKYYMESLKIAEQAGNKEGISNILGNIGSLYMDQKKYEQAAEYFKKAIRIGEEIQYLEAVKTFEHAYYQVDSARHDFEGAFYHHKRYIAARDRITNKENVQKQTRLEMQYAFDKKEAEAHALQEKKDMTLLAEKNRQKIIMLTISLLGALFLAFALIIYRSFLQKKKANREIRLQKEFIEVKQKEILDSIHYARKIQNSFLPKDSYIEKTLRRLRK